MPSQSILTLINNRPAPSPRPSYRPACSAIGDSLTAAAGNSHSGSENKSPGCSLPKPVASKHVGATPMPAGAVPSAMAATATAGSTQMSITAASMSTAASAGAGSAETPTAATTNSSFSSGAGSAETPAASTLSPTPALAASVTSASQDPNSTASQEMAAARAASSSTEGSASSSRTLAALPKRKKGAMGDEEKKMACVAAQAKSEALTEAVRSYIADMDEAVEAIAKAHGLAGQAPTIKSQRAVSNWNVLMYFKTQELNAKGSRSTLNEIQDELHEDEEMMDILKEKDGERMKQFRRRYEDEKADSRKVIMRVLTRSSALIASNSLNACQAQINYCNENTGAWGMGIIARSSYNSTIQSGFFGRGDIDAFFRKNFQVSVEELTFLLEDFACTESKMGSRKLNTNEMHSATVELILNSLRQITGITNIQMSYARYDESIRAAQGVMIEGWPEDIEFRSPANIKRALDAKTLYDAWKSGKAFWRAMTAVEKRVLKEELAERDPAVRAKRSDTGGKHRRHGRAVEEEEEEDLDDDANYQPKKDLSRRARKQGRQEPETDEDEEDRPPPKKNTHKRSAQEGEKRRRHRRDAENDEDQGEEDQPQPKKRRRIFKKSGDEGASQPQKKGSGPRWVGW
ncbi:hypothetical protein BT96DRAFT_942288 [Gymnopus androsaceus JB14]|uniref:Uncharacterized protein n=1 Tax=Gymnopus androsaceus JB14 TaxID=1447944 RepID=A0A6A4HEL9_9AGAR|nr:hypothetical protein BT96DRAFT_942288 [Gymnopus androsaceus JB14]